MKNPRKRWRGRAPPLAGDADDAGALPHGPARGRLASGPGRGTPARHFPDSSRVSVITVAPGGTRLKLSSRSPTRPASTTRTVSPSIA